MTTPLSNPSLLKLRYQYRLAKRNRVTPEVIQQHLKLLDKHQQLVPYIPKRAQAHFLANRTGRDLVLKNRQVGFSSAIEADMSTEAWTRTVLGAVLAHDDLTTQKLRRMAARFYNHLPENIRPPRGLDNATTTTYPLTGSEITIVTAGNPDAGIGSTLNYLHGSEVSRWRNGADVMAGIVQGVTKDGIIVFESTAYGASGIFYEMCMEAIAGEGIYRLFFYPWWWDEDCFIPLAEGESLTYTEEEQRLIALHSLVPEQVNFRRLKQRELKDRFLTEYPEDPVSCFMTTGGSVFGNITECLYTPDVNEPIDGHIYVCGIDWGQDVDHSVLCIMDVTDNREVVLERWRQIRWDDIRRQMVALMKTWHVSLVLPEKNSASTNIESLTDEIYEAGLDATVSAQVMTNKLKSMLVATLRTGLDEDGLKLLNLHFATQELRAFASSQTAQGAYTYSAPAGQHDDTVMARMLCYFGVINRISR